MHFLSRMIGILLVAAVAAASAGVPPSMLPAAQTMHPAGCHGHAPARAPVDYRCCIAGHSHAMPASLFSGIKLLPCFGMLVIRKQNPSAFGFSGGLSIPINHGPR